MKPTKSDLMHVKLEHAVNESWSNLNQLYEEIKLIVETGPQTQDDMNLMRIAANVAYQHMTLSRAEENYFCNSEDEDPDMELAREDK
jgi:hypothetical protein